MATKDDFNALPIDERFDKVREMINNIILQTNSITLNQVLSSIEASEGTKIDRRIISEFEEVAKAINALDDRLKSVERRLREVEELGIRLMGRGRIN